MVRGAQQYEYTQCHSTVQFNMIKRVYFVLCVFYHSKKTFKNKMKN